jgi:single-stranded-DNA-specific exonuclease
MKDTVVKKGLHPSIKEHLEKHGFVTDDEIEQFLKPMLKDLPSPFLMKNMEKAADLVIEAINGNWEIIIWGDYDVDGITAAALLILFFRKLNIEVRCHIPNRLTEGYGLNEQLIREIAGGSNSKKLLITVDCGISNAKEINYAQNLGIKVIVTDHHNLPENRLEADATINPKQLSCEFPFKELSGVGVAFYLAAAIRSKIRNNKHLLSVSSELNMKSFMGLVMLGTIADVVPLTGVNRILAKAGTESLARSPVDGIASLLDELNISRNSLNSETISFQIAPVINAAGRLGTPKTALKALISEGEESRSFVKKLIRLNNKRKKIGSGDLETAIDICRLVAPPEELRSLVIKGPFHDGLLGITASRLVDKYNVPVLVCCIDQTGDQLKGSARAPDDFNLYKIIDSCSRFLIRYGGHQAAAGFSLKNEYFEQFRNAINNSAQLEYLNKTNNNKNIEDNILILPVSEAFNPQLLTNLSLLEPLGEGNPKPTFKDDQVRFVSLKHFGKNREHVRGMIRGKYENIPFIGFNVGSKLDNKIEKNLFSVKYSHMLDTYNNGYSWKLRIENIWQ